MPPAAQHRSNVDAHEGKKRAIVEQFGSELVAEDKRPNQADGADQDHVIARNAVLGAKRRDVF